MNHQRNKDNPNMLLLLLCVLLFIAGLVIGPLLAHQQGYVLIVMAGYSIEMSLLSFLLLALLALAGVIECSRLLSKLMHFKRWLRQHQQHKAEQKTREALFKLLEEDHQQAELMFISSARHSPYPLLSYLLAAEAAKRRADWPKVQQHLIQAATVVVNQPTLALEIIQIRWQLATQQTAAMQQRIKVLLLAFPKHPALLRLVQEKP